MCVFKMCAAPDNVCAAPEWGVVLAVAPVLSRGEAGDGWCLACGNGMEASVLWQGAARP